MIHSSIIISSYNRLALLRRTLHALANRGPSAPFELILVDDGSTEDVLGELRKYDSCFPWKFVRFSAGDYERKTNLRRFFNNPCVTNNVGFRQSQGEYVYLQGNEVIPWDNCYDKLLDDAPVSEANWLVVSTTYDMPGHILEKLDSCGGNLTQQLVESCEQWPLQSPYYRSDVTNYLSLVPRTTWERIGGYDERYYSGIGAEDSDFVRRCRALPGFKMVVSDAVSIHQSHGGKTKYYEPKPSVITQEKFRAGCATNRAIYDSWNGKPENPQRWRWGHYGVKEIISNC
jgi:glycosyltransferase involved in cell wall biosynthesis